MSSKRNIPRYPEKIRGTHPLTFLDSRYSLIVVPMILTDVTPHCAALIGTPFDSEHFQRTCYRLHYSAIEKSFCTIPLYLNIRTWYNYTLFTIYMPGRQHSAIAVHNYLRALIGNTKMLREVYPTLPIGGWRIKTPSKNRRRFSLVDVRVLQPTHPTTDVNWNWVP